MKAMVLEADGEVAAQDMRRPAAEDGATLVR